MERRFGGGAVLLHRAELLDVLGRTVGSAHIHLDHLCMGIEQDSTGVMARFGNGATARGDILIGADGLHSVVRAGLGLRDKIRYSGYTAWRVVVPFDASKVVPGETWGRGRRFGAMPIHNGRVYWYATDNTPEGGQDRAKAALLSLFKGWHEPIEALIRATDESMILRNDIYDRDPVSAWGRGRITLLGDAAHPMTPNLGQGACQAIEDALVLATRLTGATTPEAGLRDYESRRIPRTSRIVMASRRVGALGQVESAFLCSLRDTLVRLTPPSVTYRSLTPVAGYEDHLEDY